MKSNAPIGIFDSGIGGLTIAHAIKKKLPEESIIYFGDTEHLPYGEKSNEAIQNFAKKITRFLKEKGCKAIIIACNSASSVAAEIVQKEAKNIITFDVIQPVIDNIIKEGLKSNIGIIGTKATIQSEIYNNLIKKSYGKAKVSSLATPLLAPMIEEGFIHEEISHTVISNYLSHDKLKNIDQLILACTHYPLIYNEIKAYYKGRVDVINSANIIAKHIATSLQDMKLLTTKQSCKDHFYVSNYTHEFEKSAKFFFKEKLKLEEINLWQ